MKLKKILCTVVVFAMLLNMLGSFAFATGTDTADVWDGTADTSWYDAEDPKTEYTIETAEQLAGLAELVSGETTFAGVTFTLANSIDLKCVGDDDEPVTFRPIGDVSKDGTFEGTFDGANYTVKNLYQNGWALGYEWGSYGSYGLFGNVNDATIKNLTVTGAESVIEGGDVGGITGSASGTCVFENITVSDSVFATYNNGCGGIIGWSGAGDYTFKNVTIDSTVNLVGLWGSFDSSIGGVVGQAEPGAKYAFDTVDVSCRLDIYNDVIASYKYYNYRMCGMLIGRLEETIEINDRNYPDMDKYGITLKDVDVTIGEWANYHYCIKEESKSDSYRVEAGYSYDGVPADYDHTKCQLHHNLLLPFNTLFGGEQYGVSGNDVEALELFESLDTSSLEVTDLAEQARMYVSLYSPANAAARSTDWVLVGSYDDFAEALEAAQDGYMLKFTNDADIGNVTIDGKDVIIDLNGHTVNGAILPSTGNITVKNGTIINNDKTVSAIEINSGSLVLDDVNIESARHALRIDGDVDVTVNGGTYKTIGSKGVTQHAINISGEATVTINGGTFIGPKGTSADSGAAVNARDGAKVTINDGVFKGGLNKTIAGDGEITVLGGAYDQDPTAYLGEDLQIFVDDLTGLYMVSNVWTVSATADKSEIYAGDTVKITVKADGGDFTGANWTLAYDDEKFEYVSSDEIDADKDRNNNDGTISGWAMDETTADAYTKDTALAVYTFKAIAQTTEVTGEFEITKAAVGTAAMAINTLPEANKAAAVDVTILLKKFTATVYHNDDIVTEAEISFPYDGAEHTISVKTDPAATVSYKLDDGVESTTAPVIKKAGVYEITYWVDVPAGYDQTAKTPVTIKVTITDPEFEVEVADYVSGYKLVLVYTDAEGAYFRYDNSAALMLDVTAAGYNFVDDEGNVSAHEYKYVYGYVVPGIMVDEDTYADDSVYKAKVKFEQSSTAAAVVTPYDYNVNCSTDNVVDLADVIYTRSVYNAIDSNMAEAYMKRILKADVAVDETTGERDKSVGNADITAVKTEWENNR